MKWYDKYMMPHGYDYFLEAAFVVAMILVALV